MRGEKCFNRETERNETPPNYLFRFEKAKLELLDLSLIKINVETGLISIHRLVQQAYFDQMTAEARLSAFHVICALLRKAFPDREGETHLFKRWAICEQLHQHVQALCKVYAWMKDNELAPRSSTYQTPIRDDIW